jgi:hypothetical protein
MPETRKPKSEHTSRSMFEAWQSRRKDLLQSLIFERFLCHYGINSFLQAAYLLRVVQPNAFTSQVQDFEY